MGRAGSVIGEATVARAMIGKAMTGNAMVCEARVRCAAPGQVVLSRRGALRVEMLPLVGHGPALQVVLDVVTDFAQVVRHVALRPPLEKLLEVALQHPPRHPPIHCPQLAVGAAEHALDPLGSFLETSQHLVPQRQHLVPLPFIDLALHHQGAERLQRDGLAVVNGVDVRSHRPALGLELGDRTALLLRLPGQGLHHASLPRLGGTDHQTSRGLVVPGSEHQVQRVLDGLDQVRHLVPELGPSPPGQGQQHRAVGLTEVVDVDPVRAQPAGGLDLPQQVLHEGGSSGAHQTGHEQVVALTVEGETGVQGAHGPFLAEQRHGARLLAGRFQRRAIPAQISGRQPALGLGTNDLRHEPPGPGREPPSGSHPQYCPEGPS